MKRITRLTAVCAFLFSVMPVSFVAAQHELPSNDLMYHAFRLPQSNQMNPAFFARNTTFYFTLPRVGMSFSLPLAYNELGFTYNPATNKTSINLFDLADKMSDNTRLNFDLDVDVVGFGFRVKRMFFTLGSSVAVNANVTLPKDAFDNLTTQGKNLVGVNNALVIASDDFVTLNSYVRLYFGGGYEFEQLPLTVGARINLLNGIANVNTTKTDIRLYASDEYYSQVVALMDYQIQSAGLGSYKNNKLELSGGSPNNWGYTFDLGASYAYDKFLFSAALLDIGPGIHWKQNVLTHRPKKNTITFDGVDITNLIVGGQFDTSFAQAFRDSLTNVYEMKETEGGDFWYTVPSKIKLGASYTFADNKMRAGFLFHGQWDKGLFTPDKAENHFRFNTTLSFTINLADWIEVMAGNSLVFDSHRTDLINPGAGVVLTPFKSLQFYTMLDYLSSFYLVDCKNFNISLGFNILMSDRTRKSSTTTANITPIIPEMAENL